MASAPSAQSSSKNVFEQRLDDLLSELSKVSGNMDAVNSMESSSYSDHVTTYSTPTSAFIVTPSSSKDGANDWKNLSATKNDFCDDSAVRKLATKHYLSQIPSNLADSPSIARQVLMPPQKGIDDETLMVLSPPNSSSSGDCDPPGFSSSGYRSVKPNTNNIHRRSMPTMAPNSQNGQHQLDNWNSDNNIVSHRSNFRQTLVPRGRSGSGSKYPTITINGRRSAAVTAGSREDTCDSTKYSSDTDTTMSGAGSVSGSNDFLSRLEQVAAKQPGSSAAPLPFSYLSLGNNAGGNSDLSPPAPLNEPTAQVSPPLNQHQIGSDGYYNNNPPRNETGYEYEDCGEADDTGSSPSLMMMNKQPNTRPPPPPPPLPRQRPAQALYNSPASRSSNSCYSPHASVTSPTSSAAASSTAYYPPGPGSGVFTHAQYNSPLGLYSKENVADAFRMQTGGVVTGVAGLSNGGNATQPSFESTPLFQLIQEEEKRQQRRQVGFNNLNKQYSADEGYVPAAYRHNQIDNGISNSPARRIAAMSGGQRQRPGSSMAHFSSSSNQGARQSPKQCYDQVLATLPRRPNRWSANAEREAVERQAAMKGRCSSATRCLTSSPSGIDETPLLEDRQIRYRGAKIPSRTFQLLHAYTEFTAKDEVDRVVPNKATDTEDEHKEVRRDSSEPIATVVICERPSRFSKQQNNTNKDLTAFDRGAIQGDGPPRPAVPSRAFMALKAVLDNSDEVRQTEQGENKEASPIKDEKPETSGEAGKEEGQQENRAETVEEATTEEGDQKQQTEDADENQKEKKDGDEQSQNDDGGALGGKVNGVVRQPVRYQRPPQPQQPMVVPLQRPPLKISIAPTRIRPAVPRAPTWERRPFRHEVSSMRTPASKLQTDSGNLHNTAHPNYYNPRGNVHLHAPLTENMASTQARGHQEELSAEPAFNGHQEGSDEPYRHTKLKVMTHSSKGPATAPRTVYSRTTSNNNSDANDQFSHFGDATDF